MSTGSMATARNISDNKKVVIDRDLPSARSHFGNYVLGRFSATFSPVPSTCPGGCHRCLAIRILELTYNQSSD